MEITSSFVLLTWFHPAVHIINARVVVEAGTSETKTETKPWAAETKTETEAIKIRSRGRPRDRGRSSRPPSLILILCPLV